MRLQYGRFGPRTDATGERMDARNGHVELILDAVKAAGTGEHRLFRSGKLPGLFPSRAGAAAEAAGAAVRDGLLETARTEVRGKVVTEWVKATPKGLAFVHDHDSPKSVLRELAGVLQTARDGLPGWTADTRRELSEFAARFEDRAAAVLARLDDLADRVEAALRRAEATAPAVAGPVAGVVPWAVDALAHLDRRRGGACPLPELFAAVRERSPDLSLTDFQDGLRRLHDVRAVKLVPADDMPEPEYAIVVEGELVYAVTR